MAAPANNPFGLPSQVKANPFARAVFGAPSQGQPEQSSVFGASASTSVLGTGQALTRSNSFSTLSAQTSTLGAQHVDNPIAGGELSAVQKSTPRAPSQFTNNPFGQPHQSKFGSPFPAAPQVTDSGTMVLGAGRKENTSQGNDSFRAGWGQANGNSSQGYFLASPKKTRESNGSNGVFGGYHPGDSITGSNGSGRSVREASVVPIAAGFATSGQAFQQSSGAGFGKHYGSGLAPAWPALTQAKNIQTRQHDTTSIENQARINLFRIEASSGIMDGVKNSGRLNERTKELSKFAHSYADKMAAQLQRDNIQAPQLQYGLGDPAKRGLVDGLKEKFKKYRSRVYASLRKAELIDDPEKKKRLEDALPFKGICEEMCPTFEQVSRISEFDVTSEEKNPQADGTSRWPEPTKMVKKFGRSAAGQDAPLPGDIRSIAALSRTTDYLFKQLLRSDENLPCMHNFLWDRTRAIRRDFIFHSHKSKEEMREIVLVLERITRFHATSLHLLSQKGVAQDDFDQKQEIEQLGNTLLSLKQAYDVCNDMAVECDNEAEFRAYYYLLNANDPFIARQLLTTKKKSWYKAKEVQTVSTLIRAMNDVADAKGPLRPRNLAPPDATSFTTFFTVVEDPKVSYTMACIAEVHFTHVRQSILRALVKAYARDGKTTGYFTPTNVNRFFRFDNPEEAREFCELHSFDFSIRGLKPPEAEPYMVLNKRDKYVPSPRVRQSHSAQLVERKRHGESLTDLIYNTIYETADGSSGFGDDLNSPNSLFVAQGKVDGASGPGSNDGPLWSPDSVTSKRPISRTPSYSPGISTHAPSATTSAHTAFFDVGGPTAAALGTSGFKSFASLETAFGSLTAPETKVEAPGAFTMSRNGTPAQTTAMPSLQLGKPIGSATSPFPSLAASSGQQPEISPLPLRNAGPSANCQSKPAESGKSVFSVLSQSSQAGGSAFKSFAQAMEPVHAVTHNEQEGTGPLPPRQPSSQASVPTFGTIGSKQQAVSSQAELRGSQTESQQLPQPGPQPSKDLPTNSSATGLAATSTPAQHLLSVPKPIPSNGSAPQKLDLLDRFTKWFVTGDKGLMEQFVEVTVHDLVSQVFEKFQEDEAMRKKKEADEEALREAMVWRDYNLGLKFFYRWHEKARNSTTRRILRAAKQARREYIAQQKTKEKSKTLEEEARQMKAAQKAAVEAAEREAQEQAVAKARKFATLASIVSRQRAAAKVEATDAEKELLVTGIFSGLPDQKGAARCAVQPSMGTFTVPDSPPSTRPWTPESTKVRSEGGKTRALREEIINKHAAKSRGQRSASLSSPTDRTTYFLNSLPDAIYTNFGRKRSAEEFPASARDSKRQAKRTAASTSHHQGSVYWKMRARGFVSTIDGRWLPDAMPISALESAELPAAETVQEDEAKETSARQRLARLMRSRIRGSPSSAATSPSPIRAAFSSPLSGAKRKRPAEEQEDQEDRDSSTPIRKMYISKEESDAALEETQQMLRDIKERIRMADEGLVS